MSARIDNVLFAQTSADGSTRYEVAHIQCDTAADLPGVNDFPNITLIQGSESHDIDQNAVYMMKSDGTWILQQAGSAAYTKSEVDTMISTINETDTAQQTEIDYSINTGSKNLLKITERSRVHQGVSFTVNSNESVSISGGTTGSNSFIRLTGSQTSTAYSDQVPIKKGKYILSCPGAAASDTFILVVGYRDSSDDTRHTLQANAGNEFINEFEIATDTGRIDVTLLSYSTDSLYSATVYPMIRLADITDGSYQPYAPTNRELYEMILAL